MTTIIIILCTFIAIQFIFDIATIADIVELNEKLEKLIK